MLTKNNSCFRLIVPRVVHETDAMAKWQNTKIQVMISGSLTWDPACDGCISFATVLPFRNFRIGNMSFDILVVMLLPSSSTFF